MILKMDWAVYLYTDMYLRPWRLLVVLYSLPGFLAAIFIIYLRESPKFLMSQGREFEALQVLKWLYSKNTGKPEDTYPVTKLIPEVDEQFQANKLLTGRYFIKFIGNIKVIIISIYNF